MATGLWMYDGVAPTTVRVVKLDYDFWYAIGEADDNLEADESPQLNADGCLFYVLHRPGWPAGGGSFWPDSMGFHTLDEAVAAAEAAVPGPVVWQ